MPTPPSSAGQPMATCWARRRRRRSTPGTSTSPRSCGPKTAHCSSRRTRSSTTRSDMAPTLLSSLPSEGAESGSGRPSAGLAMTATDKVALVIGAGDATGGAIARRFAREGYVACVTRRSADKLQPLVDAIEAEGGRARGFPSDARKEEEVVALIEQIESTIGPIEVLVFNIGANVRTSILEESARKYFKIWEMACFSGFLNAREVAKRMVTRQRGTIIFTGA